MIQVTQFQSTPSGGKATWIAKQRLRLEVVSIHAFRGEGDPLRSLATPSARGVSIHAFRGEGDRRDRPRRSAGRGFNPRLPGGRRPDTNGQPYWEKRFNPRLPGGRRLGTIALCLTIHQFQSTPSGGKATSSVSAPRSRSAFQSTPSGGKATSAVTTPHRNKRVSIHAFRGEGDVEEIELWSGIRGFQSTPSGGKATPTAHSRHPRRHRFNPRLPGGRRLTLGARMLGRIVFQSTPSGGKATNRREIGETRGNVSIHAFRGEGDLRSRMRTYSRCCFNPRLPGGRRPGARSSKTRADWSFQSTPSGGKATNRREIRETRGDVSIHAFRGEGDPPGTFVSPARVEFQSTPSGGKATGRCGRDAMDAMFQSTPSGGKATVPAGTSGSDSAVSIHAFRGEGDKTFLQRLIPTTVSIHAFRGEGDRNI